ncbi:D-2-hydroxyacid dehydrogenase [Salarchaeum japonicum]|uniref:D-2-hydroxyacid dehydrogenase n=1 Tax=Salarchaeum japonicum TaxID=555573 RepID=A0AAV3T159_9EURY|nr:D-2-hydroxyacid dehydrogenase [Salarchaeum japonicum]
MNIDHLGIHDSVSIVFPPERLRDALESVDPDVSIVGDDLDSVDAVVTFLHRDAFLDSVEWVHSIQAGYDRFPLDDFADAGVAFTNSSGIHGASVGEYAVGQMLALARRLHTFRDAQHEREWTRPDWDEPFTLFDERLTVVGLGALGQGIARRADGVGMRVTGVRRTPVKTPHTRAVYGPQDLHDAIADARFVALACPLTDDTEGLFGPDEFAAMRDDAYLVNVARGEVVQEDALVDALDAGELAGAALDVFEDEPLDSDSPLWDYEDVLVTPHAAAAERDYYEHIADLVRQNVLHANADEEFVNRVA